MNRDSQEQPVDAGRWRQRSLTADRALRAVLAGLGTVAAATGSAVAIRGSRAIPGGTAPGPSTDSVLRFYAVWWAAQGPVMWRLARQPRPPWGPLAAVLVPTFLGGLARLAARRRSGVPHPLFQVLTAAELIVPPVLLLLRRRLNQLDQWGDQTAPDLLRPERAGYPEPSNADRTSDKERRQPSDP